MAKNTSPLNEAHKPPKPSSQGGAAKHNIRPPEKGGIPNQSGNTMGGLKPYSIKAPGSGTNGRGTKNSLSRT
jgi:hypothetical protein